ncbi:DNA primase [Capnocytophaga catalasegens]|uniref:DNA primase n=1 Tax=Capnocytophaga catalasegens TaxID=1004260 RepID=A0AAV5AZI3_9FLAO|nr:DNA primase [Capnocytophaga catalasegens]GIZ16429.1 DNA primase [Capnocytophaga catalasegens]GJM50332.1 DNA primase [Capnocytophaga catalasegens]GJM53849.1 DNA primase [Capnocytophaga catalasegens]
MITKETIDKVYDIARVEEVIGDFVQLKRAGSNYKGLSPFSNERTPSFMVSPVKQIWKDFSSGKGGNVIAFLMEHEHFTYVEAIRYLANKYNIEIIETQATNEDKAKADEKESMYLVSEYACNYFQKILFENEQGKAIGLTYFKERGFSQETIRKFQLGYALDQWTTFTDEALKSGYQLSFLEKTGLSIVKEDKYFDRFKGRVMFPIHSMSGRVLGFGGRILTQDKKAAKYVNSPESEIYHKSQVLYGIFFAKQAIAKADNCYLVEGYTDVIQLHQRGIQNVVASSGTALTPEQIRLIHRLTPNITMLYDGDSAGLRASLRGIDLILEQGMNVKICTFPEGEDPDSFTRKMAYEDLILYLEENTQDFIRFKASLLISESKNDPLKRAETVRDMIGSISKIPDPIKQEIYIRECATIMEVSEETLFSTLSQLTKQDIRKAEVQRKKSTQEQAFIPVQNLVEKTINRWEILENELIKNLVLHGQKVCTFEDIRLFYDENGIEHSEKIQRELSVFEKIFLELQQDEIELSSPDFRTIFDLLMQKFREEPTFDLSKHINELPPEVSLLVASIVAENEKLQIHNWNEKREIIVTALDDQNEIAYSVSEIIANLRELYVTKLIKNLQNYFITPNDNEQERKEKLLAITDYLPLQNLLTKRVVR